MKAMVNRNQDSCVCNLFHVGPAVEGSLIDSYQTQLHVVKLRYTSGEFDSIKVGKLLLRFEFSNSNLILPL